MDILQVHVDRTQDITIVEADNNQIVRYENWLIRKLADGNSEMIQSILVSFDLDDKVIDYCKRRKSIDEKTVRQLNHEVTREMNRLTLKEIDS